MEIQRQADRGRQRQRWRVGRHPVYFIQESTRFRASSWPCRGLPFRSDRGHLCRQRSTSLLEPPEACLGVFLLVRRSAGRAEATSGHLLHNQGFMIKNKVTFTCQAFSFM